MTGVRLQVLLVIAVFLLAVVNIFEPVWPVRILLLVAFIGAFALTPEEV